MKCTNWTLRSIAATVVAAVAAFVSQAHAATVVYVDPVFQETSGPTVSVGIFVSGLTQSTAGVGLTLGWDGTILSGSSYTVDPTGGMGVALDPFFNDYSIGFSLSGDSLGLQFVADLSIPDEAALFLAEGSGLTPFKLATVTFNVLGKNGLSPVNLSQVALSDFNITKTLDISTANGAICVGTRENCAVAIPEPTSMLLVATALGVLAMRRRKAA